MRLKTVQHQAKLRRQAALILLEQSRIRREEGKGPTRKRKRVQQLLNDSDIVVILDLILKLNTTWIIDFIKPLINFLTRMKELLNLLESCSLYCEQFHKLTAVCTFIIASYGLYILFVINFVFFIIALLIVCKGWSKFEPEIISYDLSKFNMKHFKNGIISSNKELQFQSPQNT